MRILITGSSSWIGKELTQRLKANGNDVIEIGGSKSGIWKLGQDWPNSLYGDVLIHLAHDRKFDREENLLAVEKIVKGFQGHVIFLSSLSAHSQSKSIYGQSKFRSEELIINSGGTVIRAGVVFGDKKNGIYQTICTLLERLPIIPMPYMGNSRLFVTNINDLCDEIAIQANLKRNEVIFGAHVWPLTFEFLMKRISKRENLKTPKMFGLPSFILDGFLIPLKRLGVWNSTFDSLLSLSREISSSELSYLKASSVRFRMLD